jgi:nitroimidazol reductase NimA-like FMN-containing flavoprotein (pyridoxamine 5'-phosphate oxidase superfamily)
MTQFTPTDRTQVKRLPARGAYDSETVFRILDEGFLCHVGFVVDGQPFVIPTGYARVGETIYIHGSAASRMLRTLSEGVQVCVTVTLIDGLVLARSVFHHSMNYRSVVVLGRATLVEQRKEKMRALEAFTEQVVRGRWKDARKPTDAELKATSVLSLPLAEVSAKIRTGPPKDDEEDYALPIWAGVVPLRLVPGSPVPDPRLDQNLVPPPYAQNYSRNGGT